MTRKSPTPRARSGRQRASSKSSPSVSISFGPEELQFLMQTLRELPVTGTPDNLAQVLPLIQTVRLKFATAFQQVAEAAPPVKAPPTRALSEAPPEA